MLRKLSCQAPNNIQSAQHLLKTYVCITYLFCKGACLLQGDGLLLEREEVAFDAKVLDEAVSRHLEFWGGGCPPSKVPQDETWKCKSCTFNAKCWPAHRKAVPWQH